MSLHSKRLDAVVRAGGEFGIADEDTGMASDIYPSSLFAERPVVALLCLSVLLSLAGGVLAGLLQLY